MYGLYPTNTTNALTTVRLTIIMPLTKYFLTEETFITEYPMVFGNNNFNNN